jgi:hypothetical protein
MRVESVRKAAVLTLHSLLVIDLATSQGALRPFGFGIHQVERTCRVNPKSKIQVRVGFV